VRGPVRRPLDGRHHPAAGLTRRPLTAAGRTRAWSVTRPLWWRWGDSNSSSCPLHSPPCRLAVYPACTNGLWPPARLVADAFDARLAGQGSPVSNATRHHYRHRPGGPPRRPRLEPHHRAHPPPRHRPLAAPTRVPAVPSPGRPPGAGAPWLTAQPRPRADGCAEAAGPADRRGPATPPMRRGYTHGPLLLWVGAGRRQVCSYHRPPGQSGSCWGSRPNGRSHQAACGRTCRSSPSVLPACVPRW
jgi:hypothetical protein